MRTLSPIRLALLAFMWLSSISPGWAGPPNFVFILVDDLGKQDMSCEGSTFYETPNIDRLAASSLRFDNGYSACQVCSPSRAALQTGKVPPRVKITDYISPNRSNQPEQWSRNTQLLPAGFSIELALEEQTIAEALKTLGYHTFFTGKWHLGGDGFLPTDQGYDINIGGHEYGTPPGGFFAPHRNKALIDGPPGEHLPLRLGAETAAYIQARRGQPQPFFAMLSFYSVHAPIQTTQTLWSKYRDKAAQLGLDSPRQRFIFDRTQEVRQTQDNPLYAGMMESMDAAVGMVLNALQESGQAENTVVIFTSDNGGVSSGDGYATSALPMRGGKGRQWEGGIRQPFYISVPGKTSGLRTAALASAIDFFPTLVELAGGDPNNFDVDGLSLVPALEGKDLPARPLYWHYPHYGNQGGEPSSIIRDGDWKLIHYYEDGRNELYNLNEDIGEQQDLAKRYPDKVQQLSAALKEWLQSVDARLPTKNPKYDADAYVASVRQAQTVRMPQREREHATYFDPAFVPAGGGWWQDRGKAKTPRNP
jgi:arylsulfatase A-like enzyme